LAYKKIRPLVGFYYVFSRLIRFTKNNIVTKYSYHMNFKGLIQKIEQTHTDLQETSVKAVNTALTIRNWLIGFYIVEYEQKGEDRARYGKKLLDNIAGKIAVKGLTPPELSRCRQFYNCYPQIFGTVSQEFKLQEETGTTLSNRSGVHTSNLQPKAILGTVSQELPMDNRYIQKMLASIPFSHFTELIKISDPVKRRYYEMLTIKQTLSFRELQRQINTLSFERLGLSKNTAKAFRQIEKSIKPVKAQEVIKDFYFFEFLQLPNKSLLEESTLENALLNHLEKFVLELGNGFCFEARQKRILVGDEYFFIDMVFYHRILKCHVLVELKVDKFDAAYATQLKNYVRYYNKYIRIKGDNPAIGILLVTDKNKALVEFTLDGLNEKMFVSKYALELPTKRQLQNLIRKELKKL
jgi:predicted nuclease of restriction endonuclease-like (RecB) superfamily